MATANQPPYDASSQSASEAMLEDLLLHQSNIAQSGTRPESVDDLHNSSRDVPDSPLRPPPLSFSPKPQSPASSPRLRHSQPVDNGAAQLPSATGSMSSHRSKGTMRSRNSVKARRNTSRSSRPEPHREGRPLDSPMVATLPTSPERTQSMFSFDESQQPERDFFQTRRASAREPELPQEPLALHDDGSLEVPERTQSDASAGTIPGSMFRDFDGVHLDEVDEEPELSILESEGQQDEIVHITHRNASHLEGQSAIIETMTEASEASPFEPEPIGQQEGETQILQEQQPDASDWYAEAAKAAVEEEETAAPSDPVHEDMHLAESEDAQAQQIRSPRQTSAEHAQRQRKSRLWREPPPTEGMVYYPAPVPMNINLPKRLSNLPDLDAQAQRRSRWVASLPEDARKSVAWLPREEVRSPEGNPQGASPGPDISHAHRKTASNMKNLPPQLRASLFFDQPAVEHKVKLKRGSAMLTLDNLLDESTTAPVTAFRGITDAYVPQRHGRTTSMMMADGRSESRMSRGSRLSMIGFEGRSNDAASRAPSALSGRRSKSMDRLNQRGNRTSSVLDTSKGIRVVRSEDGLSQLDFDPGEEEPMTMGDKQQNAARDDMLDIFRMAGEPTPEDGGEGPQEEDNLEEVAVEEVEQEAEEEEQVGPPTTLLAELQLRKAKLRDRNRTAANAFPNGMHSTLLELEAVAQIERQKRNNKRTALAWEDRNGGGGQPEADDNGDDDVPLGMLFPERQSKVNEQKAQQDWNRPLGLLAKRERENNEPLSARRNRILGIKPAPAPAPEPQQREEEEEQSEHGEETLAQRTRRLRSTKALDEAIGGREGAQSRAISDDFASEMMSQFGGGIDKVEAKTKAATKAAPEEETLGQRRKRLQAEALARSGSSQRMSMANLLSTAPVTATGSRNVSGESRMTGSSGGGLLGQSELRRMQSKQHLLDQNTRSGLGLGLGGTFVDLPSGMHASAGAGTPQIYTPTGNAARQSGWGIAPNSFAQGFGAIQAPQPMHPRGSMLWAAQEERRAHDAKRGQYYAAGGVGGPGTYAAGTMPFSGMHQDETMSPVEREKIDQWRQSIRM